MSKYLNKNGTFNHGKWQRLFDGDAILTEAKFAPGDKYSNDFDYQGMLKFGATAKFSTEPTEPKVNHLILQKALYLLEESFTDVNYHKEVEFLSSALEFHEDGDLPRAHEELLKFNEACIQTLKEYN